MYLMKIPKPNFATALTAGLVCALLSAGVATPVLACTAALIERGTERVVVKSYDWRDGSGFAVFNPVGNTKKALLLRPSGKPHTWTAKHASLTMNQHGPQFPVSGMNDAGLVVETLWLAASRYPETDKRPVINELQFVQWLLDSFASTAGVLGALPSVRVVPIAAKVHWLVCDKSGACASIEYLDGKLVTHSGPQMQRPALTNHPYGAKPGWFSDRARRGSQRRYKLAKSLGDAKSHQGLLNNRAQKLLNGVRAGTYTKWQLIWNAQQLTVRATALSGTRTARTRTIDLNALKRRQASSKQTLAFNLSSRAVGGVTRLFAPVNRVEMTRQVSRSISKVGVKHANRVAARILASGLLPLSPRRAP
jgi:hypothetical protein